MRRRVRDSCSGTNEDNNGPNLTSARTCTTHGTNDQLWVFNSFFARASLLSNLLQSQLATPLMYPLNSRAIGGDGIRLSKVNNPKWDKETLTYGLAQVAPAIAGLSRVATILRAAHTLHHFRGRHSLTKSLNKTRIQDSSRVPQFNDNWHPKARINEMIKAEVNSLHLKKKQLWKMKRPLFESETVQLGWRAHGPPPFIKGKSA